MLAVSLTLISFLKCVIILSNTKLQRLNIECIPQSDSCTKSLRKDEKHCPLTSVQSRGVLSPSFSPSGMVSSHRSLIRLIGLCGQWQWLRALKLLKLGLPDFCSSRWPLVPPAGSKGANTFDSGYGGLPSNVRTPVSWE